MEANVFFGGQHAAYGLADHRLVVDQQHGEWVGPEGNGIGIGLIDGGGPGENVAVALEAQSLDDVTDPVGRTFRAFADQTKS